MGNTICNAVFQGHKNILPHSGCATGRGRGRMDKEKTLTYSRVKPWGGPSLVVYKVHLPLGGGRLFPPVRQRPQRVRRRLAARPCNNHTCLTLPPSVSLSFSLTLSLSLSPSFSFSWLLHYHRLPSTELLVKNHTQNKSFVATMQLQITLFIVYNSYLHIVSLKEDSHNSKLAGL